jgi:hypothetical protein
LTKALLETYPAFKETRIKVYGWLNPSGTASTSNDSNIPGSYAIVPNKLEMDQAVLRFDRLASFASTRNRVYEARGSDACARFAGGADRLALDQPKLGARVECAAKLREWNRSTGHEVGAGEVEDVGYPAGVILRQQLILDYNQGSCAIEPCLPGREPA